MCSLSESLAKAQGFGLDLVEIAPDAAPPVCKILDFYKYRYAEQKKLHEARRKTRPWQLKEVKMRPRISSHDLEVKIHRIEKFLERRDKVRVGVVFFGRENTHPALGGALLAKIQERLPNAIVESPPRLLGNQMSMLLGPKR